MSKKPTKLDFHTLLWDNHANLLLALNIALRLKTKTNHISTCTNLITTRPDLEGHHRHCHLTLSSRGHMSSCDKGICTSATTLINTLDRIVTFDKKSQTTKPHVSSITLSYHFTRSNRVSQFPLLF